MLTANPSWLISPESFLQAAEAGTRAAQEQTSESNRMTLGLAGLSQRASESAADRAMQERELEVKNRLAQTNLQRGIYESDRDYAARLQQLGIEQARQELASRKADQPKIVHSAEGVFSLDPASGQLQTLWSKPKIPQTQTVTEHYPAVSEQPALVTPAYTRSILNPMRWFGDKDVPAVTNAPAIPGHPAYSVTRKVPAGSPLSLDGNSVASPDIEPQTPQPQQFDAGTQVRQNGILYEFDGENWNEVPE